MDFHTLQYSEAQQIVSRWRSSREVSNLAYIYGDHWQGGAGWVGPYPDEGDALALKRFRAEIEREFCFHDVVSEIVWRAAKAVAARPPRWGASIARVLDEGETTTAEEDAVISEMDALSEAWALNPARCIYTDDEGRLQTCDLRGIFWPLALQLCASRRAVLRIVIPPAATVETAFEEVGATGEVEVQSARELPQVELAEALDRIHIELCPIEGACVETDRDTMKQIGIVLWQRQGANYLETSFLDPDRQTVLRKTQGEGSDENQGDFEETTFDLKGRLMHLQLYADGVIKPSLISQQKDINRRLTMSGRSSNLAGFPERVLLDAELDGKEVDDPKAPGGKRFVPNSVKVGAGTLNNFKGEVMEGENGEYLGHKDAKYLRLDPIDTTKFDASIDASRARMLGEAHQAHALIAGDATASGISRIQARDEFRLSVVDVAAQCTRALQWMLETSWCLALETSKADSANYDGYDWTGEIVVYEGSRPADERAQDLLEVAAGTLSKETSMARGGIDDIDAERARIAAERAPDTAMQVSSVEERAALADALREDGVDTETRWRSVWGFDDEQIARLHQARIAALGDGAPPVPAINVVQGVPSVNETA